MASFIHLQTRTDLLFAAGPGSLEINLNLEAGTLTGLYGSSGSGKTTLLRILAGLTTPEWGQLVINGQTWLDTDRRINLPTQQRSIGMVFQDTALFPHMTVRENVRFAATGPAGVVDDLLELVGLHNLADRKPATLSGGQRQRAALIRALARRPQLLLLDEPFSALDGPTREQLLNELVRLHRQFGTTTLLVSHQQAEMERTVDQLIWLEQGKIRYTGPVPSRTEQSARLNQLSGTLIETHLLSGERRLLVQLTDRTVLITTPSDNWQIGDPITLTVAPQPDDPKG